LARYAHEGTDTIDDLSCILRYCAGNGDCLEKPRVH
jgi:hypothetical protein